jgi:hypothetical protein
MSRPVAAWKVRRIAARLALRRARPGCKQPRQARLKANSESNVLALSSPVKLLITNNAFCIVQRATAQTKTEIFRDYGVIMV